MKKDKKEIIFIEKTYIKSGEPKIVKPKTVEDHPNGDFKTIIED